MSEKCFRENYKQKQGDLVETKNNILKTNSKKVLAKKVKVKYFVYFKEKLFHLKEY